jgi:hypothetical protein
MEGDGEEHYGFACGCGNTVSPRQILLPLLLVEPVDEDDHAFGFRLTEGLEDMVGEVYVAIDIGVGQPEVVNRAVVFGLEAAVVLLAVKVVTARQIIVCPL